MSIVTVDRCLSTLFFFERIAEKKAVPNKTKTKKKFELFVTDLLEN